MTNRSLWAGRALSGLFVLFILGASVAPKPLGMDVATVAMRDLGWPDGYVLLIGVIELTCVILSLIPRTRILGAVLLIGLLGGAVATKMRVESPLIGHTFFGIYLGIVMWGGLRLRDPDLRRLFPLRRGY